MEYDYLAGHSTQLTVDTRGVGGPVIKDFNLSSTLNGYK